jgi:octaprenyl-diphosphate synthase
MIAFSSHYPCDAAFYSAIVTNRLTACMHLPRAAELSILDRRPERHALRGGQWRGRWRRTGSTPGCPRYARSAENIGDVALAVIVPFESHQPASIDQLSGLLAGDMERVNATILSRTGSEVAMIPEVAQHLIDSGGKRLRPMLTLAMAVLSGYPGDGHVKLAAAVEFMHTATLLHDDVVDESDMRRGRLAARMLWGNEASVLVGDFLLGQAFKMMVEVGSLRALEILSAAAAVIAEGEVMQLAAAKNTATTEDEYLTVIRAKTAELFAAACEVGPVIAGRSKAEQAACRSFGMNLGVAFQLVDDALDYGGKAARLGKNVGDDFREGKITLPVVLAFRRGSDGERAFWQRTLERGEMSEGDLDQAIGLMTRHRAIEDTVSRARHYGAIAKDALALFPNAPMKEALEDAVAFSIERTH